MATVIGLKKTKQEIKIDDSPDSPSFVMDMGATSVWGNAQKLHSLLGDARKIELLLSEIDEDNQALADEAVAKTNELYETIIDSYLEEGAYQQIVDYISGGNRTDALFALAPLIEFFTEKTVEVIGELDKGAKEKYLADVAAQAQ